MKPLVTIFLLIFSIKGISQPLLNDSMLVNVIGQEFDAVPLYWQPVDLPLTLHSRQDDRAARLLNQLYRVGAIERERNIRFSKSVAGKKSVDIYWTYRWLDEDSPGILYGKRRFQNILSTSPLYQERVTQTETGWFVLLNVAWYVTDMPNWVHDAELSKTRIIRRSLESYDKPFESGLVFYFSNDQWRLWEGDS